MIIMDKYITVNGTEYRTKDEYVEHRGIIGWSQVTDPDKVDLVLRVMYLEQKYVINKG